MLVSDLYKEAVNSITAYIAKIDSGGIILETHRACKEYGNSNGIYP